MNHNGNKLYGQSMNKAENESSSHRHSKQNQPMLLKFKIKSFLNTIKRIQPLK